MNLQKGSLVVLFMLAVAACKTTKQESTTTMSLQKFESVAFDRSDTIYMPWQLWSDVEQPPLPIVKSSAGRWQAQRSVRDTTHSAAVQETAIGQPSSKEDRKHFHYIYIVGFFIVLLWLIYLLRRK